MIGGMHFTDLLAKMAGIFCDIRRLVRNPQTTSVIKTCNMTYTEPHYVATLLVPHSEV